MSETKPWYLSRTIWASLVTVMMAMGLLGALLTFAPRLLYPAYTNRILLVGGDAIADQQLAGLVMWVPASVPYLAMGLLLARAWFRPPHTGARDLD